MSISRPRCCAGRACVARRAGPAGVCAMAVGAPPTMAREASHSWAGVSARSFRRRLRRRRAAAGLPYRADLQARVKAFHRGLELHAWLDSLNGCHSNYLWAARAAVLDQCSLPRREVREAGQGRCSAWPLCLFALRRRGRPGIARVASRRWGVASCPARALFGHQDGRAEVHRHRSHFHFDEFPSAVRCPR